MENRKKIIALAIFVIAVIALVVGIFIAYADDLGQALIINGAIVGVISLIAYIVSRDDDFPTYF